VCPNLSLVSGLGVASYAPTELLTPYMLQAMPPRSSLTSSFSVTDANNEVVCPLSNHDGTNCRKRCLGVSVILN